MKAALQIGNYYTLINPEEISKTLRLIKTDKLVYDNLKVYEVFKPGEAGCINKLKSLFDDPKVIDLIISNAPQLFSESQSLYDSSFKKIEPVLVTKYIPGYKLKLIQNKNSVFVINENMKIQDHYQILAYGITYLDMRFKNGLPEEVIREIDNLVINEMEIV